MMVNDFQWYNIRLVMLLRIPYSNAFPFFPIVMFYLLLNLFIRTFDNTPSSLPSSIDQYNT